MTAPNTAPDPTAGARLADDLAAFVRSRKTLLFVESKEERRVSAAMVNSLTTHRVIFWDCVRGAVELDGSPAVLYRDRMGASVEGVTLTLTAKDTAPPQQILRVIDRERERAMQARRDFQAINPPIVAPIAIAYEGDGADRTVKVPLERVVWVLRDFDPYLRDPGVRRHLRNLAESLRDPPREGAHAIVVLTTSPDVPADLQDAAVAIRWTLPDRVELGTILDVAISGLPEARRSAAAPNGTREAAIEAAVGLSASAAETIFKKSLVTHAGKIDPVLVAAEKRKVVNTSRGMTWEEADPRGLTAIGGLDNLKAWLLARRGMTSDRARAFGCKAPRGIVCVGPPGTGKSLTAKAVAAAWGVPLLRLDLGACKGGIVGQSEQNIRSALALADTIGRCVVLIDECEKAFAGASGGALDGGVSSDALGTFLTWMQERTSPVFVVATANRVDQLPPELLRKGRFDAVFAVDLPNAAERAEILRVALRAAGRSLMDADVDRVARESEGFAGVEVYSLVEDGLIAAFADSERDLRVDDLLEARRATVPLSKTAEPQIKAIRAWAKDNAKPASRAETVPTAIAAKSNTVHGGGEIDLS